MACAVAVMAKAPVPGRCKTRLAPALGPDGAAAMSAAFLRDITENLRAASGAVPILPYVAYAPDGAARLFDGVLAAGTQLVLADGAIPAPEGVAGFGLCLLHALQTLFAAGATAACVLNSDSPTLPTAYLRQAADWLADPTVDAVMGPAEDGGYYLLGMRRLEPALLAQIDWSTERVAAQTRGRAHEAGLSLRELPPWYDVDDASALQRLRRELTQRGEGYAAPATASCLAALDARAA